MQAWRVHQLGHFREVLRLETCEPPIAPADGVVIEVHAIGLNFPDLLAIAGKYQIKPALPFIPGHEVAGVVTAAGPRSRFRVGQRVIGNGQGGACAELVAVPDMRAFAIPDEMRDDDAAALCVVYQTSYFALHPRAALRAGETLLVHGAAGGVGTSAIQLGLAAGARVIAVCGGADKVALCQRLGAHHVIDHQRSDFVAEVQRLTDGRSADVIYDPVGGDSFDRSLKCVAWGGRLLVIGFAGGRIPEVAANRILLKNISIIGLHWGEYYKHDPAEIHRVHERLCALHAAGQIAPVIGARYPLAELPRALEDLEQRRAHGKIVVVTGT